MIKIENADIQKISANYANYIVGMKRHIKRDNPYLAYTFNERNFMDIVLCPALSLSNEIRLFDERFPNIDYQDGCWREFRNYMVGQYEKARKGILNDILKSLNLSVCPYCNRQYVFYIDSRRNVSAQFDHFYGKSKYPYLALSFYNLIPCCSICNKSKGEEPIEINPYIEGFGDDAIIKIDSPLNCILNDDNWNLKFESNDRCKTNINAFALEELYKKHKDYAHEIVLKSIANQEGYFNGLRIAFKNWGITDELIERILWGNYLDETQLLNRPLSRMTVDILNQFKNT